MSENRNQNSERPREQRVEEWLGRTGQTVGMFASLAGLRLARVGVFVREEFEDMWAETQSIRRAQREGRPSETAQAFNKAAGTVGGVVGKAAQGSANKAGEAAKSTSAGESTQSVHGTDSTRKWAGKLGVGLRGAVNKAAVTAGGAIGKVAEKTGGPPASSAAETADDTAASREGAQAGSEEGSAGTGSQVTEDDPTGGTTRPTAEGQEDVKATDSARKWAEKLGVDLQTVEGSGFQGAITVEDVRKKSREGKESDSEPSESSEQ